MDEQPPPLTIYPSRVKTVILIVISATLVVLPVLGLLLFRAQIEEAKTVSYRLYALIWIGIGMFGLFGFTGLAFNLKQLTLPKPVVTISSLGIETLWYGLIRWDEIAHIAKVHCKGQCLLGIYPKNTDEFASRQPSLRRRIIAAGVEQGFPPIYVTQLALPITVDEALAEIQRYTKVPISKGTG